MFNTFNVLCIQVTEGGRIHLSMIPQGSIELTSIIVLC